MIRSVERYVNGQINWTVLALDDETYQFLTAKEFVNLEIVTLDSIEDNDLKSLKDTRPWNQLCWTSAACLLKTVNSKIPEGEVAGYIDADCFFFYDVVETLRPLFSGSSIAIHEHRYSLDRSKWLQLSGRFNVGLVAGVKGTEFDQCLGRWRMQVLDNCEVDQSVGKCGDQTYLNEWPKLYKNLTILDDSGIAVAPWNLNNYNVTKSLHKIKVDDSDLQFFHFHGLEIGFISKLVAFYIPASGYDLNGNKGMPIYKAYIRELMNQLRNEPNLRPASKKRSLKWWINSILRYRIKMRLYY